MDSYNRDVYIYESLEGQAPFGDWLASLRDWKAKQKIRTRIDRLSLGNLGDFKSVGEGVLELRIDFGPGYRIYVAQEGENIILLLCGGDKSSQNKDIIRAKQYWEDYKSRSDA